MKNKSSTPGFPLHAAAAQAHALMQQAFAFHQGGQLDQARRLYESVLKLQPDHADAMHLLGVIAIQTGDHGRAADLIGKALAVFSGNPAFHFNHAFALLGLGQLDAALASYDRAIAIEPNYAEAYANRGNVLKELHRLNEAVASYDRAIAIVPHFVDAYSNRGLALHALDRVDEAIASYDRAIAIAPDCVQAYANRGIALQALNQFDAAIASYDKAIALQPNYAEAYSNRGLALHELGRLDAALASHDQAIAIKPDYAEAHSNRGNALKEIGRLEDAVASYEKALAIQPTRAEVHYNCGIAQQALMRLDDAIGSYSQAIALNPAYADAYWNKAFLKLLAGDYAEGWQLHEWRWKSGTQTRFLRNSSAPLWLGDADLKGKRILLYWEQGFGDTLQFCRYAKFVAELGAEVILEAPPPLAELLKTLDGPARMIASIDEADAYDYQCPLMSLPLAFKTTLETVPASIPYLQADANKIAYWRDKLSNASALRVGLAWSGGFRPGQPKHWEMLNARRNMPLSCFAALNVPDVRFYSLQLGEEAKAQLRQALGWGGPRIEDYADELHDFSDTAALVANLDLVISVDTAVAHLAGALGKPVWLLNRYDSCWRWLLEREDTPWYPTMRIFRQDKPSDWDGVMAKVRNALAALRSASPSVYQPR